MAEIIKKQDVSEKDIYGWVRESGAMALDVIDELNKSLAESARLSREAIGKNKSAGNVSELKALEQSLKEVNRLYNLKQKLETESITVRTRMAKATRLEREENDRGAKSDEKRAQQQNNLTSAYARVNTWLNTLKKEYRDLAVVQVAGGKLDDAQAKRLATLEGRIKSFDSTLKKVDANMGVHTRKVGQYENATNNLGFAFTQIVREGPALAIGLNTFILAISNNLPMLSDEIIKLVNANKDLQAQGKPTQSVFKNLLGAVFSLQTGLSIGVTLLTLFGAKIVDAFTGAERAAEVQKRLNTELGRARELVGDYIGALQDLQNFDKISKQEAIKRIREQIKEQNKVKDTIKAETKEIVDQAKLLKNQVNPLWTEAAQDKIDNNYVTLRQANEAIKLLKDEERQLELAIYQEKKRADAKKETVKVDLIDLSNKKEALDILKLEIELLEMRNNFEQKQIGRDLEAEVRRVTEAARQRGEVEITTIDGLLKKERELEQARIDANFQREFDLARSQQQIDIAEENRRQANIELDQKYADKRKEILGEVNAAQEEFANKELETQKKLTKQLEDEDKKRAQSRLKWLDFLVEQEIKRHEKRLERIDKEITAAEKQQDYFRQLAEQGNINAQQSLAEQQRIINEANRAKEREQRRIERLKLFETGLDIYSSKVAAGDKQPLLNTLKDVVLLKQAINNLPSFFDGTENTGKNGQGVDGKGGFHAILHPNERVMPEKDNVKTGGMSNEMLADLAHGYNSGRLIPVSSAKQDHAGTSLDIVPMVRKMDEVVNAIKTIPAIENGIGASTRDYIEWIEKENRGNKNYTRTHRKYRS